MLIILLDLLSEIMEVLVLLLLAGLIVLLTMVRQLVDLQAIVLVLGDLSLLLKTLNVACANSETLCVDAGLSRRCWLDHPIKFLNNYNFLTS